jgi:peptidyl-prolyl cis-trans isomerase B (cyclophilin B)
MKALSLICTLSLLFGLTAPAGEPPRQNTNAAPGQDRSTSATSTNEGAVIKTSLGEMVVEFWPDVAPKTVENFKKLARDNFFDGTASHRMIPGFMVQMGDPNTKSADKESTFGTGDPGYKIPAEFSDRKHARGVLSMARGGDPMERTGAMPRPEFANSGGSQFFICFGAAQSLDNRYTVFGKVIRGEDVLAKIEKVPVTVNRFSGERSKPETRIGVESIRIIPASEVK